MESTASQRTTVAKIAAAIAAASLVATPTWTTAAPFAYVPGRNGTTVSRIDLATNEAIPIEVGQLPTGVAANASGSRVVISNNQSGTVTIIDGTIGVAIGSVPVSGTPFGVGMTADGAKAYAADSTNGGVDVIDVAAGTVIKSIPTNGYVANVAMSPSGHRAYVSKSGFPTSSLFTIDTETDLPVADILLGTDTYPGGAAATEDFVYVGTSTGIAIIDAATNLLVDEVAIDCGSSCDLRDLTVTPDGATVYAGMFTSQGGTVALDTATRQYVVIPTSYEFSYVTGVDVTPDGSKLYVITDGAFGAIDIVDTSTNALLGSLLTLVPAPMAIGEFIAGPGDPPTPTQPPVLDAAARTCQKALLDSFKPFAAKVHQLFSGCLRKLQVDRAAGAIKPATIASCDGDLDATDPTSKLSRARATSRQRALGRCAGVAPAAMGSPCDASAASIGATADCMLDRQLEAVAALVGEQVAQPCGLLELGGIAGLLPGCTPP